MSAEAAEAKTIDEKPPIETAPVADPKAVTDPPKKEEKKLTQEEMEEARNILHAAMFGGASKLKETPKPKPEEKKEEPKQEEKKIEEPKPEEKKVVPPKKKKEPVQVKPEEDPEDVISRTASATGRAVAEALKGAKPEEKPEPELDYSDKDKRTLEVLRELEKSPKYKGIADDTVRFWKKEEEYIRKWEAANPNETFNAEDEAHADFYKKHEPSFDDEDFEEAKTGILKRKIASEVEDQVRKKYEPQIKQIELANKLREAAPVIAQAQHEAVITLIQKAAPELAKMMEKEDGSVVLDDAIYKAMVESDPVALRIMAGTAERVRVAVAELRKLTTIDEYAPREDYEVTLSNKEKFKPHAELLAFSGWLENKFAEMPPAETAMDGRTFLTQAQMGEKVSTIMTSHRNVQEKRSAVAKLQRSYWTLEGSQVEQAYIADQAERIGKQIKDLDELLTLRSKKGQKTETTPKPEKASESKNGEAEKASETRAKPPSSASASDRPNVNAKGAATDKDRMETVSRSMWG